jgi:16S rRNA G966 N2-methylase RsmD
MNESSSQSHTIYPSGHSSIYIMHKFFGRKSENVFRRYIEQYTERGEVVLDPFCGSGVTVGEALRLGRKVIGIDINPVSIFIARNTLSDVPETKIFNEFNAIATDIKNDILNLYLGKCKTCQTLVPITCFTWKKDKLVDKRYTCPTHGKIIEPIKTDDYILLEKINEGTIREFFISEGECKYWFPSNPLYYKNGNAFLKKEKYESIDELFTKRNLIALAKLRQRINSIQDSLLREAFLFAFSSFVHLATKMTPVRPSRPFSSAWIQPSYWSCPHYMESNVWILFERAIFGKQGLLRAKNDLLHNFKERIEAKSFKDLQMNKKNNFLLINSSIHKLDNLPPDSIDYIITDPPYGRSIQYGELLFLWGTWLDLLENYNDLFSDEIVINHKQNKSLKEYESLLYQAFKKIFILLKSGKFCTVTFHNPSLAIRNILYRSLILAGFSFIEVRYQPPTRPSAKSLLQPAGSQQGDYFFLFQKPSKRESITRSPITEEELENWIVKIVIDLLKAEGKPIPYNHLQNLLDPILYRKLNKTNQLLSFNPKSVEKFLFKHVGTEFQLIEDEKKVKTKRKRDNLWYTAGIS